MWQLHHVPLWRQVLCWWRGLPCEPAVMRRVVNGQLQERPLTEAEWFQEQLDQAY